MAKKTADVEDHKLYLDRERTKQVILRAPLVVKQAELERIKKWLDAVLFVEGSEQK